jgi:hypothetical protein
MMKLDMDVDKGHNIHNNLFIKTFSDPENTAGATKENPGRM